MHEALDRFFTEAIAADRLPAPGDPFDKDALDARVKAWLEENELPMKTVAQPARVSMTGRTRSPGLFEVMEVLGKEKTLARLRAGAKIAADAPPS